MGKKILAIGLGLLILLVALAEWANAETTTQVESWQCADGATMVATTVIDLETEMVASVFNVGDFEVASIVHQGDTVLSLTVLGAAFDSFEVLETEIGATPCDAWIFYNTRLTPKSSRKTAI